MKQLYKIKKQDVGKATDTLSQAFASYILYTPVIENQQRRKKFLYEMNSLLVKTTLICGNAYATSPEMEGVVLYKDEKYYNTTLGLIIKSGAIVNLLRMLCVANISGIKRLYKLLNAIDTIHDGYAIENNNYLQILAVNPKMQGQKLASKLIAKVLSDCDKQNKGCYIETGDPKNVKIYEKFGFNLMEDKVNYANGRRIYYLYYSAK